MTQEETPHEARERIIQQEQQKIPTKQTSALPSMSWKETFTLIIVLIVGYIVYKLFM